jgi:hypothetical protein
MTWKNPRDDVDYLNGFELGVWERDYYFSAGAASIMCGHLPLLLCYAYH